MKAVIGILTLLLLAILPLFRVSSALECYQCTNDQLSMINCSYGDHPTLPGYSVFSCSLSTTERENCDTITVNDEYNDCTMFLYGLQTPISPWGSYFVGTSNVHKTNDEVKDYGAFVDGECKRIYTREAFIDESNILISCHCNASLCNHEMKLTIRPVFRPTPTLQTFVPSSTSVLPTELNEGIPQHLVAVVTIVPILAVAIPIIVVVVVTIFCLCRFKRKHDLEAKYSDELDSISKDGLVVGFMDITDGKNTLFTRGEEIVVEKLTISIQGMVGRGRFGTVWVGLTKKKDPIAVKVFGHRDAQSWENEYKLYELASTSHPHILHYIVSGSEGSDLSARHYMVCDYCPLGSLTKYLEVHIISLPVGLNILKCISSALTHLHGEQYVNSEGAVVEKSPIAHRDIKSSNILLKNEKGECVLSDLGLALELNPNMKQIEMANTGQVGTYRYMAPEALDAHVNLNNIESFKQIDVYALALVMWEVLSRCYLEDYIPGIYRMPFQERVGEHPTLDAMKDAVVFEQRRPAIPEAWRKDKILEPLADTIESCWDSDPVARLTVDCVLMRVEKVMDKLQQLSLQTGGDKADNPELLPKGSSTSSSSTGSPPPPGDLLNLTIGKEVS